MSRLFDGVNDDLDITNITQMAGIANFSVLQYIYVRTAQNLESISGMEGGSAATTPWMIRFDSSGADMLFAFYVQFTRQVGINYNPYLNRWIHTACTYDGALTSNQGKVYFNSALVSQGGTSPDVTGDGQTTLRLGDSSQFTGRQYDGYTAYFTVFLRTLSAYEITLEMVNPGIISTGRLLFLPLYGYASRIEPDMSGFGRHGVGIGAARGSDKDPLINLGYKQAREYGFTYPLSRQRHNRLRRFGAVAPPVGGQLLKKHPGMSGRMVDLVGGFRG